MRIVSGDGALVNGSGKDPGVTTLRHISRLGDRCGVAGAKMEYARESRIREEEG